MSKVLLRRSIVLMAVSLFGGMLLGCAGKELSTNPSVGAKAMLVAFPQKIRPPQKSTFDRPRLALQIGHSDRISCLAFSPDGKTVASGSWDQTIKLWDVATGALKLTLKPGKGRSYPISAIAFSPDGKTLASAGYLEGSNHRRAYSDLRLWDAASGLPKKDIVNAQPDSMISSVAFSPDGQSIAATGGTGHVATQVFHGVTRIWNVKNGVLLRSLKSEDVMDSYSTSVFSPDSQTLAVGGETRLRLWDLRSGKLLQTLPFADAPVAFSHDGGLLVSHHHVWNLKTNAVQWKIPNRDSLECASTASNEILGDDGKFVKLWDISSGRLKKTWALPKQQNVEDDESEFHVALSADGRIAAFIRAINWHEMKEPDAFAIHFRNITENKMWQSLATSNLHEIPTLVFSADGKSIITGRESWNAITGRLIGAESPSASQEIANASADGFVKFSPGTRLQLISQYDDAGQRIIVKDTKTSKVLFTFHQQDDADFSTDGKYIIAIAKKNPTSKSGKTGTTHRIVLVNVQTFKTERVVACKLASDLDNIAVLALSPDRKMIALASFNQGMYLVNAFTGKVLRFIPQKNWSPEKVRFSPDRKWLATVYGDGSLVLWDARTGQRRINLLDHDCSDIAFNPRGGVLAAASGDGTIGIWDIRTATLQRTLTDSGRGITHITFSPDGRLLASSDDDGMIDLWNAASGHLLTTMIALSSNDAGKSTFRSATAWLINTPEGYFDCSSNAVKFVLWNINNKLSPAERYWNKFYRSDVVRKALRDEKIP
jgi:WD40 repeat protein